MLSFRKRKVLCWAIGFAMIGAYLTNVFLTKLMQGLLEIVEIEWTLGQKFALWDVFIYSTILVFFGAALFFLVGFNLTNLIVKDTQFKPLNKVKRKINNNFKKT